MIRFRRATAQALSWLALVASGALGAQFDVDVAVDAVDTIPGDGVCSTDAGQCTLRAAVQEANASPGEDTIVLPSSTVTLSIVGEPEDAAASGDLDVLDDLRVVGAGVDASVIDGAGVSALFHVAWRVRLAIEDVTLRRGAAESEVPIFNTGTLTIERSRITDSGPQEGGSDAILVNHGVLLVRNSSCDGNRGTVFEDGGRPITLDGVRMIGNERTVRSEGGSSLRILRSEISGNLAGVRGCPVVYDSMIRGNDEFGIACEVSGVVVAQSLVSDNGIAGINSDGSVWVTDSTIRGNGRAPSAGSLSGLGVVGHGGIVALGGVVIERSTIADNHGFAVYVEHDAVLTNVTVSGNAALNRSGGGVQLGDGQSLVQSCTIADNVGVGLEASEESEIVVRHSILAGNERDGGQAADCSEVLDGILRFEGANLVSSLEGCPSDSATDLVQGDPFLGPLQSNGGPTLTHLLGDGSPARDGGAAEAGAGACAAVDQRGARRPQGDRCDIGAVEVLAACGNGAVDPGEDCDDGNRDDGDCCTSVCRYAAVPAGDCDRSGRVDIGDLILAVGLAVENELSLRCLPVDTDVDLDVEISELVAAVGNALSGVEASCSVAAVSL